MVGSFLVINNYFIGDLKMTTENTSVETMTNDASDNAAVATLTNNGSKSALRNTMRKHENEFLVLDNPNEFQCDNYFIILGNEHIAIHNVDDKLVVATTHYGSTQFKDLCLELVKLGCNITPARGGGNTNGSSKGGNISANVNTLRQVLVKNGWSAPSMSEQVKGQFRVKTLAEGWELFNGEESIIQGNYGRGTSLLIKEKIGEKAQPKEKTQRVKAEGGEARPKNKKRNKPLIEKEEDIISEPDTDMNEPAEVF